MAKEFHVPVAVFHDKEGFICTCGVSYEVTAGGEAARSAFLHSTSVHRGLAIIIDIRRLIEEDHREVQDQVG